MSKCVLNDYEDEIELDEELEEKFGSEIYSVVSHIKNQSKNFLIIFSIRRPKI